MTLEAGGLLRDDLIPRLPIIVLYYQEVQWKLVTEGM